ncbi:helix-turn-helix transcriptional regulator [Salinarimonas ramus]|uniref:Transcriptional regulator n=1 Tax=Salinarimonas ramus TaxID=690164 RepID=A0A917QB81_9HYPH|nr:helix-turn-helix transcriptional regulator [Salinarimonas ramus]GGK39908.1 transcriptional regulator [Salinarimonas ramus]
MPKPPTRALSRQTREAVRLLGLAVRDLRLARGITVAEVAERAGVSRGLVNRVEAGDPGTGIGAAFEIAAIVGVPLFDPDPKVVSREIALARERLALLPSAARVRTSEVKDDF